MDFGTLIAAYGGETTLLIYFSSN